MKKAFDQTFRDIKREVNKKVLKVPSVEQKVLDATSNEPWGPHGLLLADIAQATRNFHEYQLIMGVVWKRINDTGKNWRHVYKALTVLEYLIAHGSERVIDEIREHAYQISTLSDFQYIDSSGRDQGNNVRRKSQSVVVLVSDKERIQEVRQKAAANRDKYRSTSLGSMNQPGSYSSSGGYGDRYDDDRYEGQYGNRDDDRNAYGRDRDLGYRDDDRYARYGDSYGHEGDKYSKDYKELHGRDGYKDDDYRGRGQSTDDYHYESRHRSADRDKDRAYEDDGQYSSRGSGAKADDHSQDGSTAGKRLDHKYSEQNLGSPPTYELAVNAIRSPTYSERDGEISLASAPKASSLPTGASPSHAIIAAATSPAPTSPPTQSTAPYSNKEVDGFDEFDPRCSFSAAPTTSHGIGPSTSADTEMDLLGFLSVSLSSNSLALVPATQATMTPESKASENFSAGPSFAATSSASTNTNQPFGDPFGDGPFKVIPSNQPQFTKSTNSFNPNSSQSFNVLQTVPKNAATEFGTTYHDSNYMPSDSSGVQPPPTNPQFVQQDLTLNQDFDILADILPPSLVNTQTGYPVPASQYVTHTGIPPQANQPSQLSLPSLTSQNIPPNSFQAQTFQHAGFLTQVGQASSQTSYPLQRAESVPQTGYLAQSMAVTFPAQAGQPSQTGFTGFPTQMGSSQTGFQAPLGGQFAQPNPPNRTYQAQVVSTVPDAANMVPPSSSGPIAQHNFHSQLGSAVSVASQLGTQAPQVRPSSTLAPVSTMPASIGSSAVVPQPSKDKFETKSTVWADTLSRGLVDLNISGRKTNPLVDIGVDFDAINRKEKRMEKPTTATVTSTVTMGKAMGSGSGMGRADASALRPPPNPMMGSSVNINTIGGPVAGMGMRGGYGVNQPIGRGVGVGMNMGMGQGNHMQQQAGFLPGGYNSMMGTGNYSQRPYGGGH